MKRHSRTIDLEIGKRFGKLIVLKRHSSSEWLLKCDCGKKRISRTSELNSGRVNSCGCIRKRTDDQRLLTFAYGRYKGNAKSRNLKFKISKEQFKDLVIQNCHYCGKEPQKAIKTVKRDNKVFFSNMNGVDRVDNNIGYIIDNCVPCCTQCNIAKRQSTVGEFEEWVAKIYEYQQEKKSIKRIYMAC